MAVQWDEQGVADLPTAKLRALRDNAMRKGAVEVVALCDAELAKRPTKAARRQRKAAKGGSGRYVVGFHFGARADKGVTVCPDGTFWSGIWIVARDHAERAPKVGAYLALHETKAEPSYRQGLITDWRRGTRAEGKIGEGMEFLVRPTDRPYDWVGAGSGERGYLWSG
jgi:hypothetical protein